MDDEIRRAEELVRQREAARKRVEELAKQQEYRDPSVPAQRHFEAEQVGQLDYVIELLLDQESDRKKSRHWQIRTLVAVIVGLIITGATLLVTVFS